MRHPAIEKSANQPVRLRTLVGGLLLLLLASVFVYGGLAAFTEWEGVREALGSFPPVVFAGVLSLASAGIALRIVRWRWLMRLAGHGIGYRDSAYLQLSGLAASVTPARAGEVLKPWLARKTTDMPMSTGVALVIAERVADLIAVVILSLGALSLLGANAWGLAAMGLFAGFVVWLTASDKLHALVLRAVGRRRSPQDEHAPARRIAETVRLALRPAALGRSVIVSLGVWGLEGVGFAWCLHALGFDALAIWSAASLYAAAILAGTLTFLPGGVGVTEASLAGMLIASGMDAPSASTATIVMRVATLWWGVALGWVALAGRPRVLRSLTAGTSGSAATKS